MKDLYTFDTSLESAIETYREVAAAYRAFFADLKLPVLVAEASSGDMGGDHSHEYHLVNAIGEDTVATCTSCGYTANDEVAIARPPPRDDQSARVKSMEADFHVWRGITKDRKTLVNAWYPRHGGAWADTDINVHAVKEAVPELDASINDPLRSLIDALKHEGDSPAAIRLINIVDSRLASEFRELQDKLPVVPTELSNISISQFSVTEAETGTGFNLLRLADGDGCPRCETGLLQVHRALELGHTFYLGTRYSEPLELSVSLPNSSGGPVPIQMGCYGIGVSRIFGAVAEHMADQQGLNWPRAIAPFEVVIIPPSGVSPETLGFYDMLAGQGSLSPDFDIALDDRKETFGWKMQDADMIGYPVTVVLGKAWRDKGICEVQCRSLALKENVAVDDVPARLRDLLARL
ncbi:Proline--tRNA ligase, cytoplasmic [Tolypocladium ophioglossoides CBS 100239]|uniref:Proline--tRNA ligase, cytoplasmic n=1 Tax=Tolypocladium ophioglossoides (strain CBS 100239) TaxID=1163406 RepID=A0A0L0N8D4_TOLOC|nr:Proline--tRNA ligase, cytoplasmic [Tolypocladium ophioglossoides CBS 100239]